ncbi:hypothetical protein DNF23_58660, partial [Pseudomonas syringae pv. pisi]
MCCTGEAARSQFTTRGSQLAREEAGAIGKNSSSDQSHSRASWLHKNAPDPAYLYQAKNRP